MDRTIESIREGAEDDDAPPRDPITGRPRGKTLNKTNLSKEEMDEYFMGDYLWKNY